MMNYSIGNMTRYTICFCIHDRETKTDYEIEINDYEKLIDAKVVVDKIFIKAIQNDLINRGRK